MLLITLVENAFKYSATLVQIKIKLTENVLELECRNDVMKATKESNGIGLKNLRERLNLLHPGNYILHIEEDKGTYQAYLKLNLFL
jgi:LytS/YehU family sensor histidine kinase